MLFKRSSVKTALLFYLKKLDLPNNSTILQDSMKSSFIDFIRPNSFWVFNYLLFVS